MRRIAPFLLAALTILHFTACGGGSSDPECEDGVDNDHDGLVDQQDPACAAGRAHEEDDPATDCNDGEDDDGDGLIDYPDDPGCESAQDEDELDNPTPECNDDIDNDGDGLTDYPDDPGCFSALQNTETDNCPDGAGCPQCANNLDDDDDGTIDFPDDPGCTAASDNQEAAADAAACTGNTFEQLPQNGLVFATLASNNQSMLVSPTCGGSGVEKIYEMYVQEASVLVATTNLAATVIDTVLYLRDVCSEADTELGCNDNAQSDVEGSTLTAVVQPGYHYLVVDAKTASDLGAFQLKVELFPGVGEPCDPSDPDACAPGTICRTVPGADGPTCEAPVCSDGRDDDDDGITDYPLDPGCNAPGDATEDDDCPSGPNCPECSNDVDDDEDGQTDFPADTGCLAASQLVEGCGDEQDPIGDVTDDSTPGNTSGMHDDQSPPANCTFGSGGPDLLYIFDLPVPVDSLQVDTMNSGVDTVVYIEDGSCAGNFYGCDDDNGGGLTSLVNTGPLTAGTYAIVVDSWSPTSTGAYDLHVKGVVPGLAACTDPLFAAGVLSCAVGSVCDGSICVPPDCSNGADDDGDGINDYPADPGCTDALDDTEADSCPGVGCPVCANDLDDDTDGLIDFPDDFNCVAASDGTESCETDPTPPIALPITTGTTTNAASDFQLSCGWGTETSNDRSYLLVLPAEATSLTIDTVGSNFNTVIALKTPDCGINDLFCDDWSGGGPFDASRLSLSNVAAGNYVIVVDGYFGATGNYALNIHGIVAPGSACSSPLFGAGVLACTPGESCVSGTCQ